MKEDQEKPKIIMCPPVFGFDGYVVPGSLQHKCAECGQLVWVSPSSWILTHDYPEMKIFCLSCGAAWLEKAKNPRMHELTGAQISEVVEYLKTEE